MAHLDADIDASTARRRPVSEAAVVVAEDDRDLSWSDRATLAGLSLDGARLGFLGPVEMALSWRWDRHRLVSRMLASGGRDQCDVVAAGWLDGLDDRRIAFVVRAPGGLALHAQPVDGESMSLGSWRGVLPQSDFRISPDGARIGAADLDGMPALIDDGALEVGR